MPDLGPDVRAGRWRTPRNSGVGRRGTVHQDAVARQLGFESATIAGAVHLEQFVPLLLDHFGAVWWRRGGISAHCVAATLAGEPVRCYLEPAGADRARVWMNAEGESLVLEGTAALGDDPDSELRTRLAGMRPGGHLDVLADVAVGDASPRLTARIDSTAVDARLPVITEPMRCYRDAAAFGARVAPASLVIQAMHAVEPALAPLDGSLLGVFGALELRHQRGPVLCNRDYRLQGRVLGLSASRRAEALWFRADLTDPADGTPVARMIKMDRLMRRSG